MALSSSHISQRAAATRRSDEASGKTSLPFKVEALIHTTEAIIAVTDVGSRVVYANAAARCALGLAAGISVQEVLYRRIHADDLSTAQSDLARVTTGARERAHMRFRLHRAPAEWVVIELDAVNHMNDADIGGVVLTGRDVTHETQWRAKVDDSLEGTIRTLTSLVEQRHGLMTNHQSRVAKLARALAIHLGLDADTVQGITVAALLHDLGEIEVPARTLAQPGSLSPSDLQLVRAHPRIGHDMLRDIAFPWPVARMVLEHHERWNGSGYPQRLVGGQASHGSRVLAVADVVEAMTGARPYHRRRSIFDALVEIGAEAGGGYDPAVVQACLELFEMGRPLFEDDRG